MQYDVCLCKNVCTSFLTFQKHRMHAHSFCVSADFDPIIGYVLQIKDKHFHSGRLLTLENKLDHNSLSLLTELVMEHVLHISSCYM